MPQLVEFRAEVERFAEGSFTARLVPFGEPAPMGGGTVEFQRGSLRSSGQVPLTLDHSTKVLDRIGVMTGFTETDTGAYGSFQLSDTVAGQTMRVLLQDGAVTDVSVGVMVDSMEDGTMFGQLEHVSLVDRGRFATDKIENPSRVLSVHNMEGAEMPETEEAAAPEVVQFDDSAIREELVKLHDDLDRLTGIGKKNPLDLFSADEILGALMAKRFGGKIANHALADVIGDLGTADASGLAPDTYWGAGLQFKIDRRRPIFVTGGPAPFPDTGYNLDVPKVTQEVLVDKRGAEKSPANSRALQVEMNPYPIQWYDGAVDVAKEIQRQSSPGVLGLIAQSFNNGWGVATEIDATERLEAVGQATGSPLRTDTYGNLVEDIITTTSIIEDVVGPPGDMLAVTTAQWIAILSLMDGGDRRQFALINPQNSDGTGTLTTRGIDVGGVFIFRSPHATQALQYNSESYVRGELNPMTMSVENVELVGTDVGVWGGTVTVTWPEGIYRYGA